MFCRWIAVGSVMMMKDTRLGMRTCISTVQRKILVQKAARYRGHVVSSMT